MGKPSAYSRNQQLWLLVNCISNSLVIAVEKLSSESFLRGLSCIPVKSHSLNKLLFVTGW